MNMSVSILLATYNGERYLAEQLDSLLGQTFNDFKLYISDDCSTDTTPEILMHYKAKYPEKIFITFAENNSGSAKYNFMRMINTIKEIGRAHV